MTETDIPIPKYRVGQTVYRPTITRSTEKIVCPDCLGTQKWTVTTPAGFSFETTCQRCGTFNRSVEYVPAFEPGVFEMVIRSVKSQSHEVWTGRGDRVEYYDQATCCGSVMQEKDVITNRDEAMRLAEIMAAEATAKIQAEEAPQVIRSREINTLQLKDAAIATAHAKAWDAEYELSAMKTKIRELEEFPPAGLTARDARLVMAELMPEEFSQ